MDDLLVMMCQVYTHTATDGTKRAWNATQGNALVQDGRRPEFFDLIDHDVTLEWIAEMYEGIDAEYAMTTQLNEPLLFVPLENQYLLIDGWHRLVRRDC